MKTTSCIIISIAIAIISVSCSKKTVTALEISEVEVAAENADAYPLKTCVVSGEKLDGMGDPYVFVQEGTTVKFCCKACLKDFDKDQEKYIALIKAAEVK
jgi:YHS domain-containing protein